MSRLATIPRLAAFALLLVAACAPRDPWTDGRYWRQPYTKPAPRPVSYLTGRAGDTAEFAVHGDTMESGPGVEAGGSEVARFGGTMESSVGGGRTMEVGEHSAEQRYARLNEANGRYGAYPETTAVSTEYDEHGAESGVEGP